MTVICSFFITYCFGQKIDMARAEYTNIPQVNSENSINRFRAFVNRPIILAREVNYLIPGIEYRNNDINFTEDLYLWRIKP